MRYLRLMLSCCSRPLLLHLLRHLLLILLLLKPELLHLLSQQFLLLICCILLPFLFFMNLLDLLLSSKLSCLLLLLPECFLLHAHLSLPPFHLLELLLLHFKVSLLPIELLSHEVLLPLDLNFFLSHRLSQRFVGFLILLLGCEQCLFLFSSISCPANLLLLLFLLLGTVCDGVFNQVCFELHHWMLVILLQKSLLLLLALVFKCLIVNDLRSLLLSDDSVLHLNQIHWLIVILSSTLR